MICPNCGAQVAAEDAFCGECGVPMTTPPAGSQAARPAGSPGAAPAIARSRAFRLGAIALAGIFVACVCAAGIALVAWQRMLKETGQATGRPAEATTGQALGAILFEDDFSDGRNDWDSYNEDDTEAGYAGQEYRLAVNRANYVAWGNPAPDTDLADFAAEVDVRQVEGPLDNNVGLLVRYQPDDENFYWFEISGDGYYSVDMLRADQWVTLVDWTASDAINQGLGAANHLRVVCDGNRFSFYANDTHLVDVIDNSFSSGNIGLGAGVFDEAGGVWQFDNLKVFALEP